MLTKLIHRTMVLFNTTGLSVFFSINSLYLIWIWLVPTSAVPVSVRRLESLCSGSRPSETNPLTLTGAHLSPEDDILLADRLWTHAREIVVDATRLRNRYAFERIQSPELLESLSNMTVEGFPSLHVLHQQTPFLTHLFADYSRVSAAVAFVEHVRQDERTSLFSPNYHDQMEVLELKMYTFFCHLFFAIQERSSGTILSIVRPTIDATENNAERYKRDYKIIKDVIELFRAITVDYGLRRQAGSVELMIENTIVEDKRVPDSNKSS